MFKCIDNSRRTLVAIGLAFAVQSIGTAQINPPEMENLKARALAGDPQAEYDYAIRIQGLDPAQSFDMILRSARQNYVAAEDAAGSHYQVLSRYRMGADRAKVERQGAWFTIKAACAGNAASQARMSDYYQSGEIILKNGALAYGWALIAARTMSGVSIWNIVYSAKASNLVPNTSAADIDEGNRFADSLPQTFDVVRKEFEMSLVSEQLAVNAVMTVSGSSRVIVNHVAFALGESKVIQVDGETVKLRFLKLIGANAVFELFGQTITLRRS